MSSNTPVVLETRNITQHILPAALCRNIVMRKQVLLTEHNTALKKMAGATAAIVPLTCEWRYSRNKEIFLHL
jgi:hypothetical protein